MKSMLLLSLALVLVVAGTFTLKDIENYALSLFEQGHRLTGIAVWLAGLVAAFSMLYIIWVIVDLVE